MKINNYSLKILNSNSNPVTEKDCYCSLKHNSQYKIALKNYSENDASAELIIDGISCGIYLLKAKSKLIIDSPNNDKDEGLFTFFAIDSEEGEMLSENIDPQNFGLVQVKFVAIKSDTKPEQVTTIINNYYNYGSYRWWVDYYYDRYSYPVEITPIWKINPNTLHTYPQPVISYHRTTGDSTLLPNSFTTTTKTDTPYIINMQANTTGAGTTGLTGFSEEVYEKPSDTDCLLLDTLTTISLRLIENKDIDNDKPRKISGMSNPIPPAIF